MTTENPADYRQSQFDKLPESTEYSPKLFVSVEGVHTNYMDITSEELEAIQELLTKVLYDYDDLPEDIQQKILEKFAAINVDFEWWECTYEDATNVLLKITSFELDRSRNITGEFVEGAEETANKIIAEHGETCETFTTATNYLAERAELVKKYSDGIETDKVYEDYEYEFDQECDEIDAEFLRAILEDYSITLQKESEYLQSEEAIVETINANEYQFTEDGEQE